MAIHQRCWLYSYKLTFNWSLATVIWGKPISTFTQFAKNSSSILSSTVAKASDGISICLVKQRRITPFYKVYNSVSEYTLQPTVSDNQEPVLWTAHTMHLASFLELHHREGRKSGFMGPFEDARCLYSRRSLHLLPSGRRYVCQV